MRESRQGLGDTTTLDREVITLPQGPVRYHDSGTGPAIVFVHGLMVNADHWRAVVPRLNDSFRCIAPDLPLGAHTRPLDDTADLSPPGVAGLLGDFLSELDLESATVLGNDTGGAFVQILVAERPAAVDRLILTPCDTFDNFPPSEFQFLTWAPRFPRLMAAGLEALRSTTVCRLVYRLVTKSGIPPAQMDAYVRPSRTDPAVRRDLRKVLAGMDSTYTNEAARSFPAFDAPVLLVWGPDDPIFPIEEAERLAELFPQARLVEIPDTYCFAPEDRPEALADAVRTFMNEESSP